MSDKAVKEEASVVNSNPLTLPELQSDLSSPGAFCILHRVQQWWVHNTAQQELTIFMTKKQIVELTSGWLVLMLIPPRGRLRLLTAHLLETLGLLHLLVQPPLQLLDLPVQELLVLLQLVPLLRRLGEGLLQGLVARRHLGTGAAVHPGNHAADQVLQQDQPGQDAVHLCLVADANAAALLRTGDAEGVVAAASLVVGATEGCSVLGLSQAAETQEERWDPHLAVWFWAQVRTENSETSALDLFCLS